MLIHNLKMNTRFVKLFSILTFLLITVSASSAYDIGHLSDKEYLDPARKYSSKNAQSVVAIELKNTRQQKTKSNDAFQFGYLKTRITQTIYADILTDFTISKVKLGNTFNLIEAIFKATLFTANRIIGAWHSINSALDRSPLSASLLIINTLTTISGNQFDSAYQVTGRSSQKKPQDSIAWQDTNQYIPERKEPISTTSRKKRILAYLSDGSIGNTIDDLNQNTGLDKKDIRSRVMLATTYMNQGKFDKARGILKKLEKELPDDPVPFNELGNLYIFSGKVNEARNYYTKSLEKDANYIPARLNLARLELKSGKPDLAKILYEKILSEKPEQKDALVGLAETKIKTGHKKEAMKELEKVRKLYPDFIAPRIILAQIYLRNGNIPRAKKVVSEALKINPANQKVQEAQGMVLLASGNTRQALEIFSSLVATFPTVEHYFQLAQAQRASNQPDNARSSLTKGLKIDPGHMPSLTFMAFLDLAMGKLHDAIEVYNKIITQQPNNVVALNNLALLSLDSDKNRALELAKQAYKLNKSAAYADTLGWILLNNGNVKQSLVYLRKAHKGTPDNASVNYHLAVALAETGDKKKARKILEDLVSAGKEFYELNDAMQLLTKLK